MISLYIVVLITWTSVNSPVAAQTMRLAPELPVFSVTPRAEMKIPDLAKIEINR